MLRKIFHHTEHFVIIMDSLLKELLITLLPSEIHLHFELVSVEEHSNRIELRLEEYAELEVICSLIPVLLQINFILFTPYWMLAKKCRSDLEETCSERKNLNRRHIKREKTKATKLYCSGKLL
jgi:hypothetical protein